MSWPRASCGRSCPPAPQPPSSPFLPFLPHSPPNKSPSLGPSAGVHLSMARWPYISQEGLSSWGLCVAPLTSLAVWKLLQLTLSLSLVPRPRQQGRLHGASMPHTKVSQSLQNGPSHSVRRLLHRTSPPTMLERGPASCVRMGTCIIVPPPPRQLCSSPLLPNERLSLLCSPASLQPCRFWGSPSPRLHSPASSDRPVIPAALQDQCCILPSPAQGLAQE